MLNRAQIIDTYSFPADGSTQLAKDAVLRLEATEHASHLAEEMRRSTRPKTTVTASRCVTPCPRCGSNNTHTAGKTFYCFDCRSINGVRVGLPTARAATLLCPKCKSKNFSVEPKNGDLFCFGCKRWSQAVGPKGRSKYTHFCQCGSGQVDVTRDSIRCRTCGRKSMKGLH